jgi:hypothetical protein
VTTEACGVEYTNVEFNGRLMVMIPSLYWK